jgi:hypothetical protein
MKATFLDTHGRSVVARKVATLLKTAVSMIPKPTMSAMARLTMKHKTKVVEATLLLAIFETIKFKDNKNLGKLKISN